MTDPTLVPVAVACPCPGAPHDGDTVYLKSDPGLIGGALIQRKYVDLSIGGFERDDVFASLIEILVRYGVDSATFTDEAGETLDREAVISLLMSQFGIGTVVAERADDLYSKELLRPLVQLASKSSPTSRTNGSTSRKRRSSTKRPKPLKSSSTPTSPTADTEAA